ncbi:MAG: type II toxin-antitoxin system PemK/MazF family toxin [Patescibacteria group bacterium]|nr:type II toxin-antitoxin system PemK/MazF family toxin [Patescibacteria group bacterium]
MGIQRFGKEFKDTLASLSAGVVQKERRVYPKQGEVYFADLGPIISTEQAKRRPVIILSNVSFKRRNTVLVAPLSSNVSSMDKKVHCIISKLERGSLSSGSSKVLLDHVRTIDKDRLIRCEGVITENDLSVIQKKIQECIL